MGIPDLKENTGSLKPFRNCEMSNEVVVMLRDYEGYSYQEIGEILSFCLRSPRKWKFILSFEAEVFWKKLN